MINVCPNDLSWWVADTWTGLYLFPGKYGPTRFKLFCFVFNVNTPTILSVTSEVDEAWSNTASISWFIVSWVQREFPLTFILKRLGNEWHLACIGTMGIYVLSCECTRLREDLFFVTAVHTKSWTSLSLSSVDTGPWREVLEVTSKDWLCQSPHSGCTCRCCCWTCLRQAVGTWLCSSWGTSSRVTLEEPRALSRM